MRKLLEPTPPVALSPEVLSVLQLCVVNEPLFPNLKTLLLWDVGVESIPFIPLFLSPRTTIISIGFTESDFPKALVASVITTLPTRCPNLQEITLSSLPSDQMVDAAVSEVLLASNRNTLRRFRVDSSLTREARDMVYNLPDLRELSIVIERDTSLPSVALPNLVDLVIKYDHGSDWVQGFRGATFGKLASVIVLTDSNSIGDFLEAFESVALSTSISTTLSTFKFYTSQPWRPNCRSLLPFSQLKELTVESPCEGGCSSTIDDDTIINIARAMPKLVVLRLGGDPCQTPTGVTIKGLAALAYYCLHLTILRVHFQVHSLDPLPSSIPSSAIIPREDCALTDLEVGEIPVTEVSTLMVALTLLRIFPHLASIEYIDEGWMDVADAIVVSNKLANSWSKKPFSFHLKEN